MTSTTTAVDSGLFTLPDAHGDLQAEAREIAARFAPRAREIRQYLLTNHRPHPEFWSTVRARGWTALMDSSRRAEAAGGLLAMTVVLEALAEQNIVQWMPVLSTAIAHAIASVGPSPTQRRLLDRVARGEAQVAMAATEADSGHNFFRTATEIARDGTGFVVSGTKSITSGLDVAERVLVLGRTTEDQRPSGHSRGFSTVLVDPGAPGVTATELSMRHREGVRQYRLELDQVRVESDDLVGAAGQGLAVMWPFTHVERILTAALCLGSSAYALRRAVERASQRCISGNSPIGTNQALAHPLAMLHARLQADRLLVYRAAARFDADRGDPAAAAEANIAKLLTAELACDAADHAMQVFGADAWDEQTGWLDVFLDARLSRSGPVSNEFALNYIAEHVLGLPTR